MKHSRSRTSNYLHRQITPETQSEHDRAFMRTLLVLIAIAVVCIVLGKGLGYGQSAPNAPDALNAGQTNASQTKAESSQPKKAEPKKSAAEPVKPASKPTPAPKSEYTPTESQSKDLRIAQLEAIAAQKDWNAAAMRLPEYAAFNTAVNNLGTLCQKIRVERGWPAEVECDINTNPVTFVRVQAGQQAGQAQKAK